VRLTDDAQAVGSLKSRQSVMLRPEVSGRVTQINFRDADRVRRGQLLVQLDDQLPQAQVKQAEAELSIARANHKRNQELVEQKFIAQRAVDESAANLQVAEAKLALAQATLARLKIMAPFDGIAGIRGINIGDYLKDGADIVNIEDLDAVYVDFRLPERFQTRVRPGQTALVDIDACRAALQRGGAGDRPAGRRQRPLGRRARLHRQPPAAAAPRHVRPHHAGVRRARGRPGDPEEAIVPQGGRQFVYKLVDGPDQDTRIAQRVEVPGRHPPAGQGRSPVRPAARRHGRHGRPAAHPEGRHAGARAGPERPRQLPRRRSPPAAVARRCGPPCRRPG
jgi:membrane fusion protein (multidrug efflux system)